MYKNEINSTYDKKTHTRYPTLQYIKEQTGEDLETLAGTTLRAEAELRQITNDFKSHLSKNKLRETYNRIEYLVATNEEWINEWNRIIASVIYKEYNMEATREEAMLDLIKGSGLFSIERFQPFKYKYREGY